MVINLLREKKQTKIITQIILVFITQKSVNLLSKFSNFNW